LLLPVLSLLLLPLLAGCGGGGSKPPLVVSAATSLKSAFTSYGRHFPDAQARFSFGGSDQLAAQIEQGVKPDVFAAANVALPDQLYAKHLVEKPVRFAVNRLVIAVAPNSRVTDLSGLVRPGVKLAMGSQSVPVGAYTRKVIDGLPPGIAHKILANVRSTEPDVAGVVGKVAEGAVDAGFVYITDVRATHGRLRAIDIPQALQPRVLYAVAVVRGAKHRKQAKAFIRGLLKGTGRQALGDAGFEPAPRG
jgi:molybdate transport system substrate-binding protein